MKVIVAVAMLFSVCCFAEDDFSVKLSWMESKVEKMVLDWPVKQNFNWEFKEDSFQPHFKFEVLLPLVINLKLKKHQSRVRILPSEKSSFASEKGRKVLVVNSHLGPEVVGFYKLTKEAKVETKLSFDVSRNRSGIFVHHESCIEDEFVESDESEVIGIAGNIYVSCRQNHSESVVDLFGNFRDLKLVLSEANDASIKKINDGHYRVGLKEFAYMRAQFYQGDKVVLDFKLKQENRRLLTSLEGLSSPNWNLDREDIDWKSIYHLTFGTSNSGLFFMPAVKHIIEKHHFMLGAFVPFRWVTNAQTKNYFADLTFDYGYVFQESKDFVFAFGPGLELGELKGDVEENFTLPVLGLNVGCKQLGPHGSQLSFKMGAANGKSTYDAQWDTLYDKVISFVASYKKIILSERDLNRDLFSFGVRIKW